jgi:hypothetical protein
MNIQRARLGILSLLLASATLAQVNTSDDINYTPEAKAKLASLTATSTPSVPLGKLIDQAGAHLQDAVAVPACANIPDIAKAVNYRDDAYLLDRDLAGKLKISFFGSVDAGADKGARVFVREMSKYAACDATDGSGTLLYGVSLRATVLVDTTDVSGSVNFAIAAASATVKSRSVQVRVESLGFADVNVTIKSAAAQNITSSGLTVDTYGDFKKALNEAFDAAVKSNIASMQLVGFSPATLKKDYSSSLAVVFALDRITQAYGCNDAVTSFNTEFPGKKSADTEAAIRDVYNQVASGCDASAALTRATAEAVLLGHRLKKK